MPISRREFLASAATPLLAPPKPNIVFILVDDPDMATRNGQSRRAHTAHGFDWPEGVLLAILLRRAGLLPSRVGFTTG
jgi:hypothetical protein